MIYSAFITVLISVRILPVGFDSSDGSSAGTSAEGECAVWCSTLAVAPQGSCEELEHSGQEQRCAPRALAGAEHRSCQC